MFEVVKLSIHFWELHVSGSSSKAWDLPQLQVCPWAWDRSSEGSTLEAYSIHPSTTSRRLAVFRGDSQVDAWI